MDATTKTAAERFESALTTLELRDGGARVILRDGLESEFTDLMRELNGIYTGDPANWPKDFVYLAAFYFCAESFADSDPLEMAQSFAESAYSTGDLFKWVAEDRYAQHYLDQAIQNHSRDTFADILQDAACDAAEELYNHLFRHLEA